MKPSVCLIVVAMLAMSTCVVVAVIDPGFPLALFREGSRDLGLWVSSTKGNYALCGFMERPDQTIPDTTLVCDTVAAKACATYRCTDASHCTEENALKLVINDDIATVSFAGAYRDEVAMLCAVQQIKMKINDAALFDGVHWNRMTISPGLYPMTPDFPMSIIVDSRMVFHVTMRIPEGTCVGFGIRRISSEPAPQYVILCASGAPECHDFECNDWPQTPCKRRSPSHIRSTKVVQGETVVHVSNDMLLYRQEFVYAASFLSAFPSGSILDGTMLARKNWKPHIILASSSTCPRLVVLWAMALLTLLVL